ncbi:hypothetical protein ACFX1X_031930 [Malus domestica]
MSLVAFACWFIWKARCNAISVQKSISPLQVIHAINCANGAFQEACRRSQVSFPAQQGNVQLCTRWLPPNPPFYKVNIDASWTSNNRMGNVGVVIRDSGGNFVAAWKSNILAPRVEVAEALAV